MPALTLTDRLGATLEVTVSERSSLARYVRLLTQLGYEGLDLASTGDLPLTAAPLKQARITLVAREPLELDGGGAIDAGPAGWVAIFTPEDGALPGPAGAPVAAGTCVLGVGLTVRLGVSGAAAPSAASSGAPLALGFEAGSSVEFANFRAYDAAAPPRFAAALTEVLGAFTIPAGLDDLRALPERTHASVEGRGTVRFGGAFDVSLVANPLAAADLPAPIGPVKVRPRAALGAEVALELAGGWQVLASAAGRGTVDLALASGRSSEIGAGPSAAAGLVAAFRRGDLLARVIDALSDDPVADADALAAAHVPAERVAEIEDALARGLARRFELAAQAEWSASAENRVLLRASVDLARADGETARVLRDALRGTLPRVDAGTVPPPGLVVHEHAATRIARRGVEARATLLGLVNVLRLSELVREGTVLLRPGTGEWIVTDRVRANRIAAAAGGLGERSRRLRRLTAESVLATAAYRAAGVGGASGASDAGGAPARAALALEHAYVEQHERTPRATLEDDLDVAVALGLLAPAERARLAGARAAYGPLVFAVSTRYGDAETWSLFLDAQGDPRPPAWYEAAGRRALALLVRPDEPDALRRAPATDDALWARMAAAGPFNFGRLPEFAGLSAARLAQIVADYATIAWWTASMARVAERVAGLGRWLAAHPAPAPAEPAFAERREALARALRDAVRDTRAPFGDPWGLVALALAAGGAGATRLEIVGPEFALRLASGA